MEKIAASKIMATSVAEFEVSPTLALPTAAADGEYVELLEVTIILSVYIWNKKQSYSVQQANLFNKVNIIECLRFYSEFYHNQMTPVHMYLIVHLRKGSTWKERACKKVFSEWQALTLDVCWVLDLYDWDVCKTVLTASQLDCIKSKDVKISHSSKILLAL